MLTDSEKMVAALVGSVTFIVGVWFGIWTIPAAALDVPMEPGRAPGSEPIRMYQPAPVWLPALTIIVPGMAVWYCYGKLRASRREESTEAAADGGERK